MLTHELLRRAGGAALTMAALILACASARPALAQDSGSAFDPKIQLYPRASFLRQATERLRGAKGPSWLFEAVYATDDSLKEVVSHFKAQARKLNDPKHPSPVVRALLRDDWKTKEGSVRNAPTVFGVGDAFRASTVKAEFSFGVIVLEDSFVRVHLMSPRPDEAAPDRLVPGTVIVLVWESLAPREGAGTGPGGPQEEEKIYTPREVTRKARVISRPEPEYTDEARDQGVSGTVVIRAVFHSSGKVTNIRVVQGLPGGLTEEAVRAARKIKFEPAVKDGRYVSQYIQIEYNFYR